MNSPMNDNSSFKSNRVSFAQGTKSDVEDDQYSFINTLETSVLEIDDLSHMLKTCSPTAFTTIERKKFDHDAKSVSTMISNLRIALDNMLQNTASNVLHSKKDLPMDTGNESPAENILPDDLKKKDTKRPRNSSITSVDSGIDDCDMPAEYYNPSSAGEKNLLTTPSQNTPMTPVTPVTPISPLKSLTTPSTPIMPASPLRSLTTPSTPIMPASPLKSLTIPSTPVIPSSPLKSLIIPSSPVIPNSPLKSSTTPVTPVSPPIQLTTQNSPASLLKPIITTQLKPINDDDEEDDDIITPIPTANPIPTNPIPANHLSVFSFTEIINSYKSNYENSGELNCKEKEEKDREEEKDEEEEEEIATVVALTPPSLTPSPSSASIATMVNPVNPINPIKTNIKDTFSSSNSSLSPPYSACSAFSSSSSSTSMSPNSRKKFFDLIKELSLCMNEIKDDGLLSPKNGNNTLCVGDIFTNHKVMVESFVQIKSEKNKVMEQHYAILTNNKIYFFDCNRSKSPVKYTFSFNNKTSMMPSDASTHALDLMDGEYHNSSNEKLATQMTLVFSSEEEFNIWSKLLLEIFRDLQCIFQQFPKRTVSLTINRPNYYKNKNNKNNNNISNNNIGNGKDLSSDDYQTSKQILLNALSILEDLEKSKTH